jgi:hypothetical protein
MFKGILADRYLEQIIGYIRQHFDVHKKEFHPVFRTAPGRIAGIGGKYIQVTGEQIHIQRITVVMGDPPDNMVNPVEGLYTGVYAPIYTDRLISDSFVG